MRSFHAEKLGSNELLQFYSIESQLQWEPRFNIAPSQAIAVIRNDPHGDRREVAMLRWGLIPSWADDIRIGNQLINARAETIVTKPSFKQALQVSSMSGACRWVLRMEEKRQDQTALFHPNGG